jgi:5-methylcytosine-specific restriction endonuclease McrA
MSLSQGGTGIPYEYADYPEKYFRIRLKILKRDRYICGICGRYGNQVHHIDYNKKNNNEDNLMCSCRKCNNKVNFNRPYWKEFLSKKLINVE